MNLHALFFNLVFRDEAFIYIKFDTLLYSIPILERDNVLRFNTDMRYQVYCNLQSLKDLHFETCFE